MSSRQRLWFRIGCYALIVTSVVHLIGHFSGPPPPANDTERTLLQLLQTYVIDLPGGGRTFEQLMSGFSLAYSIFMAWIGAIGLMVMRRTGDAGIQRGLARINLLGALAMLVLSLTYWFIIPTAFSAVVLVAFACAVFLP
jgi:hypothetical protein